MDLISSGVSVFNGMSGCLVLADASLLLYNMPSLSLMSEISGMSLSDCVLGGVGLLVVMGQVGLSLLYVEKFFSKSYLSLVWVNLSRARVSKCLASVLGEMIWDEKETFVLERCEMTKSFNVFILFGNDRALKWFGVPSSRELYCEL